ncbi:2OG-Fe(II) oxygenase [Tundrisphaera lichenicola]|uniref:2OG-Fe(II) oxygenase n=1 Tax=Tundrisphaera lichenicola TaxID=2029860 RepID=UPI003EBCF19D
MALQDQGFDEEENRPVRGKVLDQLDEALSEIDRPGSFCVNGSAPAVLPGLEVDGLGPIGLPLTIKQAKELIKHCRQAPHGQGAKTVVDTAVRKVWKLELGRFSVTNPEWDRFLRMTIAKVQLGLGLDKQELEGHLHDFLLYEPGSFFLPHRDGEKLDRMVATLVIVLPSTYEGGELVVRHDGQERVIDFQGGADPRFHTHYAAFYADCEHEVRPLAKGYRPCLIYNLTLSKSKKPISAPRESKHIEKVGRLLREWSSDDSAGKLAITLEHQYTQDGLGWDSLKGEDRARAQVLRKAAEQSDCKAYLALLTLWESGEAEEKPRDRRRSRYGRGWGHGGYDDPEDYQMGEIYDTRLTATHWIDAEGRDLPIGELNVDEAEVLDPDTLKDVDPEEEFEGYTGNEGMTIEHWYRHAAIFVWPDSRHFEIICDRDSRAVIPELTQVVGRWQAAKGKDSAKLKAQGIGLAKAILEKWPESEGYGLRGIEDKSGELLEAIVGLDETPLIAHFLGSLMLRDPSVDPGQSIAAICQKYGWSAFAKELQAAMKATAEKTMERNVRLLEQVCTARPRKKAGWGELCTELAEDLISAIEKIDQTSSAPDWYSRKADRGKILAGLARLLIATDQQDQLSRVVAHALALPKKYPLTPEQTSTLEELAPWLKKNVKKPWPALTRWLASCREQLESLTARMPQEPKDYKREATLTCKCAECEELKRFLADPKESVHRFRVRQERRNHLETQILNHKCDLDRRTDHSGSPHSLICTKNTASHLAQLKTYHQNQGHLAAIRAIEATLPK